MENQEHTVIRVTEDPTRNIGSYRNRNICSRRKAILGVILFTVLILIIGFELTFYYGKRAENDTGFLKPAVIDGGNQQPCDTQECRDSSNRIRKSLNTTIDPCVDFYEFACGGFIKAQKEILPRNNKYSTESTMDILDEEVTAKITGMSLNIEI